MRKLIQKDMLMLLINIWDLKANSSTWEAHNGSDTPTYSILSMPDVLVGRAALMSHRWKFSNSLSSIMVMIIRMRCDIYQDHPPLPDSLLLHLWKLLGRLLGKHAPQYLLLEPET
jgi:hypothetical protein